MNIKIIAEVGWNHMGNMNLAKEMIEHAAYNGADIVKFQTWSEKSLKKGPWDNDGRREIYKKAELSFEDHQFLIRICEKNNVEFLTSVFNVKDMLVPQKLGLKSIKIPSHEVHNRILITNANKNFDKILLSAGGCKWTEVETAVNLVDKKKLILMHCISSYPCPPENINLSKLQALKKMADVIGYSGHGRGINDAIVTMCAGAEYIEKHFTIDQSLPGRDNLNAIMPEELKKLSDLRNDFILMNKENGLDVQDIEQDIHNNYRGRWG